MDFGKTIYFQEDKVLDIPLEQAWIILAETNEVNRFIDLAPKLVTPFLVDKGALIRHSESTLFGLIKIAWTENVFEWVRHRFYIIERIDTKGPIRRVVWKVSMEPSSDNKTIIELHGEFTTHMPLGEIAVNLLVLPKLKKTFDYVEQSTQIALQSLELEQVAVKSPVSRAILIQEERLNLVVAKLREWFPNEEMINRLLHTITFAEDEEVTSMKPYQWAALNGFDKRQAVELFLCATKVGMLDQEWSMMCPNCRVSKGQTDTMKKLEKTVHCDLCGVDFEIDFDRYFELRFNINASIRKANQNLYCINGPMNSPHVLGQFRIASQSTEEVVLPEFDILCRWRVLRDNRTVEINLNERALHATLHFSENGFIETLMPTATNITFTNETDEEIILVLEEVEWDKFALTARDATSYQLFRDLFATDVLSADQQISVGNLTILFTDLKGSTRLYESIGDGPAYSDVKRYFDYLMTYIRENEGAIVKTIGDSVMAVFVSEMNALKAAVAIQESMGILNESLTKPVQVRIGFHSGPVIAVNANEVLDYFGRTVNLAARIESESLGGDIVLSESVYNDLRQQEANADFLSRYSIETFSKQLQGVNEQTKLIRINVEK